MRLLIRTSLLLILSTLGIQLCAQTSVAEQFTRHLKDKELNQAYNLCAYDFKRQVSRAKFEAIVTQMEGQLGSLKSWTNIRTSAKGMYDIYRIEGHFEQGKYDIVLSQSISEKIVGFTIQPIQAPANSYARPAYAKDNTQEIALSIPVEQYNLQLPGILTLPATKPKAVVVLVHGSGPNDKDATVGPNKPFSDIAQGLASKGIASYRYDKRSYISQSEETCDDIDKEVTEDALQAITVLQQEPKLKGVPVYVLGHSLGGMLAPRIAEKADKVNGIILLGGNAYPLQDLLVEQYEYLISIGNTGLAPKLKLLKEKIERLKLPLPQKTVQNTLPLNLPVNYWRSLLEYDQVATAQELRDKRILILNGKRDYQVSMRNMVRWQEALGNKAQYKSFDGLNHLFLKGEGEPGPTEYQKASNVPIEVIETISQWIIDAP